MTAQLLTGRCHCGAVEFSVKGEVGAFYCHCEDCRLSSATPFVAWGRIHSDSFELIRGSLKTFHSSENVSWSFCNSCGTGIKYEDSQSKPDIDIFLATLKPGGAIKPAYHVQVKEKLPWLEINDGLPQYPRWRENSKDAGSNTKKVKAR